MKNINSKACNRESRGIFIRNIWEFIRLVGLIPLAYFQDPLKHLPPIFRPGAGFLDGLFPRTRSTPFFFLSFQVTGALLFICFRNYFYFIILHIQELSSRSGKTAGRATGALKKITIESNFTCGKKKKAKLALLKNKEFQFDAGGRGMKIKKETHLPGLCSLKVEIL
jgi:hypothetical protein